MDYKLTRHQVARGSRPDVEKFNRMYLIKNVGVLRATYQIRLLAYLAATEAQDLCELLEERSINKSTSRGRAIAASKLENLPARGKKPKNRRLWLRRRPLDGGPQRGNPATGAQDLPYDGAGLDNKATP
jgi:hypothetical protein